MDRRPDHHLAIDHDAGQQLSPAQPIEVGGSAEQVIHSSRASWRSADPAEVLGHAWDDDLVVFVRGTAATHWLNPSLAAVFDVLRSSQAPVSTLELAAGLQLNDEGEAAVLQECLEELRSLGLARLETATPR